MIKSKILIFFTRTIPVFAVFLLVSCKVNQEVTKRVLREEIKYLSSDSLAGRLTGSRGDSLTALYIKNRLASYGLRPLSGDGFERFKVPEKTLAGERNVLSIDGNNFKPEKDFMPLGFSANSELESEALFAGYGFNINEDSLKWNDYKDIDPKGKWVIILRSEPDPDNTKSPFLQFSSDRDKALMAKDMGAAGVLMISGQLLDKNDTFESADAVEFSVGIPVLRIKREVADFILSKSHNKISDLEKTLNEGRKPVSFSTKATVNGSTEIVREYANTRNVVMFLPGEDEKLKNEFVILGAHYDHLGMGGPASSSRARDTTGIHHGADDNASGVAMMLELARKFSRTKGSHKRSILCIAFTGEEEGLLGSRHFTEDPGFDLSRVNVMINLDMLGRLNETNNLQVFGVGTSNGLKDLIYSKSDTSVIKLTLSDEGYGPSDHSSFYMKNIPVLFYFTGAHTDYHTPEDTYDKINYDGMVRISGLIYNVAEELVSSDSRLQFKEAGPKVESVRYRRGKGVTLGIMPDFAGIVKNGLRADAVNPGKPAALGGMKKGDIITVINGKPVNNIYDYMSRMSQLKSGQTISIEVMRNDKKVILLIQL